MPQPKEGEVIYDWWSKYYHSFEAKNEHTVRRVQKDYAAKDTLKIYDDELENTFNG